MAHAIDEEQEITLKRLEHAYLVAFLQLIQICAVVFINTPTILNSSEIMMIEKVQESLKTLSIEFPDMIQVPSLSSVALLGKGESRRLGSHLVIPISMEPLHEWIFLSMLTSTIKLSWSGAAEKTRP